jgi:hypothetical protein
VPSVSAGKRLLDVTGMVGPRCVGFVPRSFQKRVGYTGTCDVHSISVEITAIVKMRIFK